MERYSIQLLEKIKKVEPLIGNTEVISLSNKAKGIFAKIEYSNFSGSIKDRATFNILKNAILSSCIKENTTIIESTSGNFGISLALFSIILNIKFIAVIDPNISPINRKTLNLLSNNVIEIKERDGTGGFLLNRLSMVNKFKMKNENVFHPNQYNNDDNYKGYSDMVNEIANQFDELNYIIVPVSTGGAISGISSEIREYFKDIKVIAVDVEGSQVFSKNRKNRNLSGIGASKQSKFIKIVADIDEVIIFTEKEIIKGCRELILENGVFAGISSGAAYCGAMEIKRRYPTQNIKTLIICPDRGSPYLDLLLK